jgi:starvation-inducible DNA-binding protein
VRVIGHNDFTVMPSLAVAGAYLGDSPMQPTHNTLSENIRAQSVELLNKHLAAAIDLHAQVKQAHGNVRESSFIAIQELFDKVSSEVENYSDLIAAPARGLGGTAYGALHVGAERSFLVLYPLGIADEQEHVFAVSGTPAAFGQSAREASIKRQLSEMRYRRFVHRNLARRRPSIMVRRIPHRPQEMIAACHDMPKLHERIATAVYESGAEAR